MNVYLIRHGETDLNINKIHQLPDTPLSSNGIQQIKGIAPFLASCNISTIYCSPLKRTKQSADIIADTLGIKIVLSPNLEEIRKPSEIIGKKHNELKVLKIKQVIKENYHNEKWHFSDEENFLDVKERTSIFMKSLTMLDESKNIIIVTHAYVSKMLLALALFNNDLISKTYLEIYDHVKISNASISKLEYSKQKGWQVLFWNWMITS